MSPIERLTPRSALHQNRVDLPVPANTVNCIKTAWIFRNCGIASLTHCTKTAWIFRTHTTKSTTYKLWQTRKKPRGPEDIRRRGREATRARRHGFRLHPRVEAETAPTTVTAVIIIGVEHRRLTRSGRKRDTDTETEITIMPPRAWRAGIYTIDRTN